MRCSSSPDDEGAPAVRMIFPPSLSASVARKVTPCRSAAPCTWVTSTSSWRAASSGPCLGNEAIGPVVVDEGDRDPAVLRLGAGDEGGPQPERNALPQVELAIDLLEGQEGAARAARVARRSRNPGPFAGPTRLGLSAAAVAALMTISPASAVPSISTTALAPGPVTTNSRWDSPTRKKLNRPLWTPTDMRSEMRLPQHGEATDHAERPAHLNGRQAGPGLVRLAREVDEQRVTAELEQAAAVGHGQVEKRDEAGVDRRGELLGARLPQTGQALGELGEPRNVDERNGALELLVRSARVWTGSIRWPGAGSRAPEDDRRRWGRRSPTGPS